MKKGFILLFLFTLIICSQKQGNLIILHDADFPEIFNSTREILIMFTAPWCNHCQNLEPIFSSIADQFQSKNSSIKFGKVDSTINPNITQFYSIEGFPKLIFFQSDQLIEYEGQRNKYHITQWLQKIESSPLIPLDKKDYQNLQNLDNSSIVFHGNSDSQQAKIVRKAALTDHINDYYILNPQDNQTYVQMIRPLFQKVKTEKIDKYLKQWIRRNQKHLAVPFDDRAIAQIFNENKIAVFLFNENGSQKLATQFTKSAKQYLKTGQEMLFAHVEQSGEHMKQFSEFLNIQPSQNPIVIYDVNTFTKSVLKKDPLELNEEEISKFLQSWQQGNEKKQNVGQIQGQMQDQQKFEPVQDYDNLNDKQVDSDNRQNQVDKESQTLEQINNQNMQVTENKDQTIQNEL